MADIPWGAIVQGAGQIMNSGSRAQGAQEASDIERDAYLRALQMLQGGQLSPSVERVGPIQRPVGDQAAVMAQKNALSRLQEASRNGYDVVDKAAINSAMNTANTNERMQRGAALSRLDPNSGAAMAARLQAQQGGANRANQAALDTAAGSRLKALQALGAYGNLATNMRGQEFNEANAIDKFNAELSRFNAGNANQASQAGIANKLNALQLAGGAGDRLGLGITRAANERGNLAQTVGNVGGNAINAFGESNKQPTSAPTSTNNGDTPTSGGYDQPLGPEYDEDLLYGDDDRED